MQLQHNQPREAFDAPRDGSWRDGSALGRERYRRAGGRMGSRTENGLEVPYQPLFFIKLNANHLNPGRVRHEVEGRPVPYPHALTIEIRSEDGEAMLRYLDEQGNELTHSHSYDLDAALNDARYEFGIQPHEWLSFASGGRNSN